MKNLTEIFNHAIINKLVIYSYLIAIAVRYLSLKLERMIQIEAKIDKTDYSETYERAWNE